jgi:hypothetical protein
MYPARSDSKVNQGRESRACAGEVPPISNVLTELEEGHGILTEIVAVAV